MFQSISKLMRSAAFIAGVCVFSCAWGEEPNGDGIKFFEQKIRPLLITHCYECHSEAAKKVKGGLTLDTRAGWQRGGDAGEPAVVPGQPEKSLLLTAVRHDDGDLIMPPKKPKLPDSAIADLTAWIKMGAPDPRTEVAKPNRADKNWWSLQPLKSVQPPTTAGAPDAWMQSSIDRFIFAKLKEAGLSPNPPADRQTLYRRLSYDLTGLPPTKAELDAFVTDSDPNAYEKLVDRLLGSPRYGEQWGRHWLDVIRFGESRGYERNEIILNAWPFRDYVIRSLNEDKPFNRFIQEHLAGDALGQGDPAVEVATIFLTSGPYDDVGNQDVIATANIRAVTVDDMVTAAGTAFLGLTFNCARCHNHKFDPIPTEDYYRIKAAFDGVSHGQRPLASPDQIAQRNASLKPNEQHRDSASKEKAALEKTIVERAKAAGTFKEKPPQPIATYATPEENAKLEELQKSVNTANAELAKIPALQTAWLPQFSQPSKPTVVFKGGDPTKPGDVVKPSHLAVLEGVAPSYELPENAPERERRLALAQWITADANPLPARVLANRVWQHHFGTGIVDSSSDFGFLGGKPTHPELLDWLAIRLQQHGWKLKPLHREIVLSQTYRQASTFRTENARNDKDARLLWRYPPRRLSAEEIRDSMLAVSGKLDLRMGGPGFRLYEYKQDNVATYVPLAKHGPDTYRRAVYHHNARASIIDLLSDFDLPDNAFAAPTRVITTTPLQALTLFNHSFTTDMAQALSESVKDAIDGTTGQINALFLRVLQRQPTKDEIDAAQEIVRLHGLPALSRALLNCNSFLYLD